MTRPSNAPDDLRFAALRSQDVPDALHLSDQAGWNQTEGDWRRLLDLQPEGALGAWHEGRLIASATYVAFGRAVHWIGMVLVDPAYRGRGVGGAIFGRLMEASLAAQPACVGLDATEYGAGLYRRNGFVPVGPIDRWSGHLQGSDAAQRMDAHAARGALQADALRASDLAAVSALDRRVLEVDRSALLQHLADEPDVRAWVTRDDDGPTGHAWLRPGRTHWHLGPAVASSDAAFAALLRAAATALDGAPVFMDAPRREPTTDALNAAGLSLARNLTRMTYQTAQHALVGEGVRLATGFEWG
ncbi:MAG: GNAT family N-acetyltransferase [Trueperaceae bacterium]|nr:GNAT family N-acetyltransferase [Trueperaceae bacterium]